MSDSDYERPGKILGIPTLPKKGWIHWPTALPIVIATLAALFTGWQTYVAERTREDAVDAAKRQDKKDAEAILRQDKKDTEQAKRQLIKDQTDARAQGLKDKAAGEALALSQRNSDRSARAAEESARIARDTLKNQIESTKNIQRARLIHSVTRLLKPLASNEKTRVITQIQNAGPTLALHVHEIGYLAISSTHELNFPEPELNELQGIISDNTVSATVPLQIQPETIPLTPLMFDLVVSGKGLMYTFRKITYEDENSVHHLLEYCAVYNPQFLSFDEPWISCATHNSTN